MFSATGERYHVEQLLQAAADQITTCLVWPTSCFVVYQLTHGKQIPRKQPLHPARSLWIHFCIHLLIKTSGMANCVCCFSTYICMYLVHQQSFLLPIPMNIICDNCSCTTPVGFHHFWNVDVTELHIWYFSNIHCWRILKSIECFTFIWIIKHKKKIIKVQHSPFCNTWIQPRVWRFLHLKGPIDLTWVSCVWIHEVFPSALMLFGS